MKPPPGQRWFRPISLWWPTWRIWLPLLVLLVATGTWMVRSLHGFLAVSQPVPADVLVVEGWMSDHALEAVIQAFHDGGYRYLVVSGGPIERGGFLSEYQSHAELAAATLLRLGFDPKELIVAPADPVARNRTYASALAVRDALSGTGWPSVGLNVASAGPHARRSWLAYRRVLGPDIAVGVWAIPPGEYDPARWWVTSEGIKNTLTELIAWLHVRVFGQVPALP